MRHRSWSVYFAGSVMVACGGGSRLDQISDPGPAFDVGGSASTRSSSTGGVVTLGIGGSASGGNRLTSGTSFVVEGGARPTGGTSSSAGGTTTATGGASSSGGSQSAGGTLPGTTGGASVTSGGTNPAGGSSPVGGQGGTAGLAGCVLFVTNSGNDSSSGTNWASALANVQPALIAATSRIQAGICASAEVWVAKGTYTPTYRTSTIDPRTATFKLAEKVALYGGFGGTESSRGSRDFTANVTTLSGDIGTVGDNSDNSYQVVTGANDATLDGFTITGGNANGAEVNGGPTGTAPEGGAGMMNANVAPKVAHCIFTGNRSTFTGAGMVNSSAGGPSPIISDCTFADNTSAFYGGGMYNYGSSPQITNCTFSGNSSQIGAGMYNGFSASPRIANCTFTRNNAKGSWGGGISNYQDSSPTIVNSTFLGNSAGTGGAIANQSNCSPKITNCTFSGNTASAGGAMYNFNSSYPVIVNSIFWADSAKSGIPEIRDDSALASVSFSIVSGGRSGTGNMDVDPQLNDDLTLKPASPAIDAGNCGAGISSTDILGKSRWDIASVTNKNSAVDIGAHEFQGTSGIDAISSSECAGSGGSGSTGGASSLGTGGTSTAAGGTTSTAAGGTTSSGGTSSLGTGAY